MRWVLIEATETDTLLKAGQRNGDHTSVKKEYVLHTWVTATS